jgi:hypothetical protein
MRTFLDSLNFFVRIETKDNGEILRTGCLGGRNLHKRALKYAAIFTCRAGVQLPFVSGLRLLYSLREPTESTTSECGTRNSSATLATRIRTAALLVTH